MKKIIFSILLAASFVAITAASNDAQKSFATVNREQGVLIFTDSKPNSEYEVLGTIKATSVNMDTDLDITALYYEQLKANVFKQMAKKKNIEKYEDAEAIIIYPDQQKADVIIFK